MRRFTPLRFLQQLAPHAVGILPEQQFLGHRQHVPALALHLALQLPRRPAGETGVKAMVFAGTCEQRFDIFRMHAEVDVPQQGKRGCAGHVFGTEQRHRGTGHHRAAGIDRLAGFLVPVASGTVEDHPHRAEIRRLRDQHHGLAEIRIEQAGLGDQQDRVGRPVLLRPGGTCGQQADQRRHARHEAIIARYWVGLPVRATKPPTTGFLDF